VAALSPTDQPFASETSQVVGHLAWSVGLAEQAGHLGTQAPIGEAGDGIQRDAQSADQSHDAWIPEAQGSGSLALLNRGQCDPLKERGRDGTALAGTLNGKQATIGRASLGLQFGQMLEPPLAAEIIGRVADGLDAQSATLLQVLLEREWR